MLAHSKSDGLFYPDSYFSFEIICPISERALATDSAAFVRS